MRRTGLVPVYWTTDTFDWQGPRPRPSSGARCRCSRRDHLLHDGMRTRIQAVRRIVSRLRGRGHVPRLPGADDKTVLSSYRETQFTSSRSARKRQRGRTRRG